MTQFEQKPSDELLDGLYVQLCSNGRNNAKQFLSW